MKPSTISIDAVTISTARISITCSHWAGPVPAESAKSAFVWRPSDRLTRSPAELPKMAPR